MWYTYRIYNLHQNSDGMWDVSNGVLARLFDLEGLSKADVPEYIEYERVNLRREIHGRRPVIVVSVTDQDFAPAINVLHHKAGGG